jgi:hypothetical protein
MAADGTAVLRSFLGALGEVAARRLPMTELRPRAKTALAALSGDYDYVVDPARLEDILAVFAAECLKNGVHLEYNSDFRNKRVLTICFGEEAISVELWTRIELSGPGRRGPTHEIEGARLLGALARAKTPEAANALLAAIYVTHVVLKDKDMAGALQQERIAHFRASLTALPDPADPALARLRAVLDGMAEGRLDRPRAQAAALDYLAAQGVPVADRRLRRQVQRRLRRAWLLSDRIVPVLGPDGSGKTYFCENLLASEPRRLMHLPFKKLFRNSKDYWILQRLFSPRRTEPANVVDERLTAYIVLKSILTGGLLARRLRRGKKTAVIDRYSWDYLFTNLRTTARPPARGRLYAPLLPLIPRPRRAIVMACSPERILERKQELDRERIVFLYDEYRHIAARGLSRRTLFYNAEGPFDAECARRFLSGS